MGRLLATLIAWARAHLEIEKLGLYVFSTNEDAVRLYQKPGFLIEAETREPLQFEDDSYADTVAMGLLLVTPRPAQAPA